MRTATLLFSITALSLLAQGPPAFEVASIKPTAHGRGADGRSRSSIGNPSPASFQAENSSLDELIRWAYRVKEYQIAGPDWLNADDVSFDITAKAPAGVTKEEQLRQMVQTMLAERFKLALHREKRNLPVYHLVVAKQGPKLHPSGENGNWGTSTGGGRLQANHVTMADLAETLSAETGRPVLDQTGIQGNFDFKMSYAPEGSLNDSRPSILAAIQEYGLRLESAKGPVDVLVIDHIEKKPVEN